jgi:hypothetical protein
MDTLNSAIQQWQTPAVDSFRSRGGDRKDEMGLDQQARFWPTPNANPEAPNNSRTRENGRIAERLTDQCLATRASARPTPANRDHRDPNALSYQERSQSTKGEQLNNFVAHCRNAVWRTPHGLQLLPGDPGGGGEFAEQATTWTPSGCSRPDLQTRYGLTFWQRVRILRRLCRQLQSSLPKPYSKGGTFANGKWQRAPMFRRKLNADFTDWLQGLALGFTSEEFDSSVMEIWWLASRRRVVSLCSPGGLD